MGNPRVFFDISIDGANAGRIIMEVNKRTPTSSFAFHLFFLHLMREIFVSVTSGMSKVWQKCHVLIFKRA